MKRKKFGKVFPAVFFILFAFFIYYKLLMDSRINESVPLPDNLHPVVEKNKDILVQRAAGIGIPIIITQGFRSISDQDMLYKQGRSVEGEIVTHAKGGESYHNFGLAIDFALLTDDGRAVWDTSYDGNGNAKSDWLEVVAIAKELGFEWGGDWNQFKDYPHLEMSFGLSIHELKRGKRPPDNRLRASQN